MVLDLNQEIRYRRATLITPGAPAQEQDSEHGPYTARIVDVGEYFVCVRADGFQGVAPMYLVAKSDILNP